MEALNGMPGIATTESCEGHARGAPAWVAFTADDPASIARIATALGPLLGDMPGSGEVSLQPYFAYGVSVEWHLVVQGTHMRSKLRSLRRAEVRLRALGGPLRVPVTEAPRMASP